MFQANDFVATILRAAVYFFFAGFAICAFTFAYTSARFRSPDSHDASQRRQARTIPYWFPYIGSALAMRDQHSLYLHLASLPQASRPLRLKLGPKSIYMVFGADNVRQIFQHSRELGMKQTILKLIKSNLIAPSDYDILAMDDSGDRALAAQSLPPNKRVWYNVAKTFEQDLMALPESNTLAASFQTQYCEQLQAQPEDTHVSVGLYKFLQKEVLTASGKAFCGEELFKQNPRWYQIFWEYDKYFLLLSLGIPRWMAPAMYRARDNYVASLRKWYPASYAQDDLSNDADPQWEPIWGSRFWRHLIRTLLRAGLSLDGCASGTSTTIWATHSNAIPATAWILFEILTRPALHEEILNELSSIVTSTGPPRFDVPKLLSAPLLNSVWREVLRTRVSILVYRESLTDICISDTLIPAGSIISAPSWPAHMSSQHWCLATGSGDSKSDVSSKGQPIASHDFDPYRFAAMDAAKNNPQVSKADKSRVATALSPNNFFPWGGGSHMCAGRNFAKQEALIGAATILVGFDIEVLGWEKHASGWPEPSDKPRYKIDKKSRAAKPDLTYAGGGVMPPDRDLRVKMKRKHWSK